MAMGVAYCKKAHNFQMESEIAQKFSGKVDHELKDSWLTAEANWQKVGVACNKKAHNF